MEKTDSINNSKNSALNNKASQTVYGARDVINAPEIKKSIKKRSQQRQDAKDIHAWLMNHFYRHIIGNFNDADNMEFTNLASIKEYYEHKPIPNWLQKKYNQEKQNLSSWYINPENASLLALEKKIVEFLKARTGTSLEGKLMRINCPQALDLWQKEHDYIYSLKASGKQKHHTDAVRLVYQTEQGAFYELLPNTEHFRAEMAYESQIMRHCLGQFESKKSLKGGYGEQYASSAEKGELKIFSYRSAQNLPKITISVEVKEDGSLQVDQVKGKQNSPPVEKYKTAMLDFLNELSLTNIETPHDLKAMNIVKVPSAWLGYDQVYQDNDFLHILKHDPECLNGMTFTSPILQWLALVHSPDALKKQIPTPSILPFYQQQNALKEASKQPNPNVSKELQSISVSNVEDKG